GKRRRRGGAGRRRRTPAGRHDVALAQPLPAGPDHGQAMGSRQGQATARPGWPMTGLRRPAARTTLTILFVLVVAAWGGFLGLRHLSARTSALDALENLSLDWRYSLAGARALPRGVVIAAIDEETIRQAGAFPLPRGVLAQIVRGIARYNPQVICV